MSGRFGFAIASALLSGAAFAGASSADAHGAAPARQAVVHESTVGLPARIEELVIPGPELVVAPQTAKTPIVLRITRTSPHGTAFRYDLEFTGLDPGQYDLRQYLRRADGSAIDGEGSEVAPIPVAIGSVLAAGQVMPHAPQDGAVPALGGYRAWFIAAASLWTIGLLALLFARRQHRRAIEAEREQPRTLAERLRPLVDRALAGELSRAERAELELGLVAYWRRKLALGDRRPEEVWASMRTHAEAGPLLRGLEDWLHRPGPNTAVDVAALLAPYRDLPADALEGAREAALEDTLAGAGSRSRAAARPR